MRPISRNVRPEVREYVLAAMWSSPAFSIRVARNWPVLRANSNTGITPQALKAQLATGKGDGEMLTWIEQNAPNKHRPWEIQQWSMYFSERGPDSDAETLEFFAKRVGEFSKSREDVKTWFDLLDLDDHVTFGGKA